MKTLFDTLTINETIIKNRFVRSAICEKLCTEDGHITKNYLDYYDKISKGNVGMIITGYTTIFPYDKPSPFISGLYDDSFIAENKKLCDIVHKNGSKIISQIVLGKEYINTDDNFKEFNFTDDFKPTYIEDIKEHFKNAAIRAYKAGFDGIQIHAAHGYFLSRSLSPLYNTRTDEFGINKEILLAEVFMEIEKYVPLDFIIGIKINSIDKEDGGIEKEQLYKTCILLDNFGVDFIEVSGGTYNNKENKRLQSIYKDDASHISNLVKCPVILVGNNRDFDSLTNLINKTNISMISLARPFISEINLINRWASGDLTKVKCISCGNYYTDSTGNKCILNKKTITP